MRFTYYKQVISLLCAILITCGLLAQNTISGKVTDNSGKTIPGASVTTGSGRGTQTNNDGQYSMTLPNGTVTLTASFVGFASNSKTITVRM
jgi:hypothetical protein